MVRILFIGDIVGNLGREMIKRHLSELKDKYRIDFTIANGENATHGKGLSLKHYDELKAAGIDCITMGNHFFRMQEIIRVNAKYEDMLRPYNLYKDVPGRGTKVFAFPSFAIRVTNLLGRVFVEGAQTNPFDDLAEIIGQEPKADIHIVDFHAETTGEKMALAKAFDGKVTAVLGTHTHVQTNDARILPLGTAFITDVGMTGYYDGILGVSPDNVIIRTWKGIPGIFEPPDAGPAILSGAVISVNDDFSAAGLEPINIIDR